MLCGVWCVVSAHNYSFNDTHQSKSENERIYESQWALRPWTATIEETLAKFMGCEVTVCM